MTSGNAPGDATDLTVAPARMYGVSDPRDAPTSGGPAGNLMRGPDMAILPPPTPQRTPLDGCPQCGQHDNRAHKVDPTPHGILAWYDCECCGHYWSTAWAEWVDV